MSSQRQHIGVHRLLVKQAWRVRGIDFSFYMQQPHILSHTFRIPVPAAAEPPTTASRTEWLFTFPSMYMVLFLDYVYGTLYSIWSSTKSRPVKFARPRTIRELLSFQWSPLKIRDRDCHSVSWIRDLAGLITAQFFWASPDFPGEYVEMRVDLFGGRLVKHAHQVNSRRVDPRSACFARVNHAAPPSLGRDTQSG